MKNIKLFFTLALALFAAQFSKADIVGNYTADASTLFLLHFNEAAGTSTVTNYGSKGGLFYTVVNSTGGNGTAVPPLVTTMLGAAAYVNGPTNFISAMTNPAAGDLVGYDFNASGAYQGDVTTTTPSPDRLAMTNLNMGNGGASPWTLEALIRPTTTAGNQEIICTDNGAAANSGRGFQFRITGGVFQLQWVGGAAPTAVSGTIPTTGNDAFVANNWYHVAATYDGATVTLYWTLLNPTNGAAHVLTSGAMTVDATRGALQSPLTIGNENRNSSQEQFLGCIDEVRISSVARGSGQMQFYSPLVTITANPVSQNVDYNQPVTFSVGASSQFALGYQWRYNTIPINGRTNTSFTITNVAASDAGNYDCVVTNTLGNSATSAAGVLVVGAANFLANRYSFTVTNDDSVGGQWGTNFGNAVVTGGQLVLDGTSGTYMQLPPNLFNAANATALTVEFWATYGVNPNNVYPFSFGNTNLVSAVIVGVNYAIYNAHNPGQFASASPGDPAFAQTVSASGNFDGQTVHVAVVFDAPNKTMAIYTNGVLEAVNTNFTVNISSLNDKLSYIGRSLFGADPYLNASIDELRIFKGALSSISIKQSQDQGPNTLLADGPAKYTLQPVSISVPAGQTATFSAATVGYLPITYQWFQNSALVSGATNASYSFATVIGDNGAAILCHATNTIGVTTYVSNSVTATLTVFIPPTLTWYGSVNNLWDTATLNWNAGTTAFAQTNGVLFDSNGSAVPSVDITQATIPYNLTVNAATDYIFTSSGGNGSLIGSAGLTKGGAGKLTIDVTNTLSGPVTISGGSIQVGNADAFGSLGSGVVTNNAALSFNRSDATLNVGNTIHGTGAVSVDGTGAITLSGNNDYTGATAINAGIVFLLNPNGLGATGSGTTVTNTAQLYVTANVVVAEGLTLSGAGNGNGALRKGGAGLTVDSAPVTLAANSTIGVDAGATLALSNAVSGAFALTAVGGGSLTLNTNNSFSGGLTLNNAVVGLNANDALGTAPATVAGNGRFVLGTGVTIPNAINATTVNAGAGQQGVVMAGDNTNGIVTTASGPLTFGASPAAGGTFAGPGSSGYLHITGKVTNTVTGVISSRDGRVRFSGGGDYTLFILNQGTLSIGANNGLCPNASLTMGPSGAANFDLNGFNQALIGVTDGSANAKLLTNSAATPSTLTFNLTAANTYNGVIGGKVALVVNGTGSLLLNGTNAYTGNTTVNGGTLQIAQPAIATNSTVAVASGAILQLDFAVTNAVASFVTNGLTAGAGVYGAGNSSPYLAGAGFLLVVPPVNTTPTNLTASVSGNTLTLSWPADHTGWKLQAQTNSLNTGLGTNWVTIVGTENSNTFNVTLNPTSASVFYRMVYP